MNLCDKLSMQDRAIIQEIDSKTLKEIKNELDKNNDSNISLRGRVQIYETKDREIVKKVHDDKNLIVLQGREWVLQRLFNVNNPNITDTNKNLFISWISFGSGGTPPTSPNDPIPPMPTDISLANEVVIDSTKPDVYADGGRKHAIDEVVFLQDEENLNRYLIARASVFLDENEANYQFLSETGLWLSNSTNAKQANIFKLFARTTFRSREKLPDFGFLLLWYIYG